jgi:trans-aconitate methyltransferase
MTDWNADAYHQLSGPQLEWGRRVAARLAPAAGECVLDLGCGTGRLTAELAASVPGARFVGADVSQAMLTEAARSRHGVSYVRADGLALPFTDVFDAVFSAAAFHWIPDHPALFREIHRVLKPGGRLVAQCGGGPNLQRLLDRAHALMDGAFHRFFHTWHDPWLFAGTEDTRARVAAVGFEAIDVWLERAPTTLPDREGYTDFISCVCVRHHVDRLPADERARFVGELASAAAADDPPFTLDYWRLNLSARKPGGRP